MYAYRKKVEKYGALEFVRDLAFAFILFWQTNPQSRFNQLYNWNLYGAVVILWILFAHLSNPKTFEYAVFGNKVWLTWLWPIYLLFASRFGHAEFSLKQFTMPFIFTFFVFYFETYKKNKFFEFILLAVNIYILIITINTYIQNQSNSEVSRFLAHGDSDETISLSSPFLAGFSFVYSLTGCCIAAVGLFKKKNNKSFGRFLCVAIWCWLIFLLINVQYVLAIVLTVAISFMMVLFYDGSKNKSVITTNKLLVLMVFFIILYIIVMNLENILLYLYSKTTGSNIRVKIEMLLDALNSSTGGIMDLERPQLYMNSINTFFASIKNFFLGVGASVSDLSIIGEHSQLFDTFGRFGIIGGGCWITSIIVSIKHVLSVMPTANMKIQKYVFLLLMLQAVVNPVYTDQLLMFYFFTIPANIMLFGKKE